LSASKALQVVFANLVIGEKVTALP